MSLRGFPFLPALLACSLAHAITVARFSAPLSVQDSERLAQTVCMPRRVPAEWVTGDSLQPNTDQASGADVLCRPHGAYAGRPLFSFARCERLHAQWRCGRILEAYRTTAAEHSVGLILDRIEVADGVRFCSGSRITQTPRDYFRM